MGQANMARRATQMFWIWLQQQLNKFVISNKIFGAKLFIWCFSSRCNSFRHSMASPDKMMDILVPQTLVTQTLTPDTYHTAAVGLKVKTREANQSNVPLYINGLGLSFSNIMDFFNKIPKLIKAKLIQLSLWQVRSFSGKHSFIWGMNLKAVEEHHIPQQQSWFLVSMWLMPALIWSKSLNEKQRHLGPWMDALDVPVSAY